MDAPHAGRSRGPRGCRCTRRRGRRARSWRSPRAPGADSAAGQELEGPRAAPDDLQLATGGGEGLGHEVTELARADDHHPVGRREADLLLDLQCGGSGLGEDRRLVGQRLRDLVEVRQGEGEVGGEGPVPIHDPEDGPSLAVGRSARTAGGAGAAHRVDLAHHPTPSPLRRVRRALDDADELVARDPGVGVVAAHQLEVRVAHADQAHLDEGLTPGRRRGRDVLPQAELPVLEPQSAHDGPPQSTRW